MTNTYTEEFRNNLIRNYLGNDLVAFLINMSSLGLTSSPTLDEVNNRINLTMNTAALNEIAVTHNYQRDIITLPSITYNTTAGTATVVLNAEFTATGGSFNPCTHICYACDTNTTLASVSNGNNAGDTTGTLISVEPLLNAPVTLANNTTLIHSTNFTIKFN